MENIRAAADYIKSRGVTEATIGIVLGTGLGNLALQIDAEEIIDYADIPNFPVSTVESHSGKLIYGNLNGKKVLAMQGRFHYYEGYSVREITYPIRVMNLLGIEILLISNAAGTVNPNFKKGELMLIDDHINMLPDNPLRGKNFDELGPRFPDMSQPYNKEINALLKVIAKEKGITLHEGVYTPVAGPNLETRAEYRYLRTIGTDAVGMSTVPEVVVANHMSMPCVAISVLTDECNPDNLHPVSIVEILEIAGRAEKDLTKLYVELVGRV
ncbi:purine-nucleoside phosphorylase [Vicingaceae bacterium]|nr:purine-nucleoside phosphorylase [Vicingaceae bacterium]MDA9782900.1 purine-nucleoside phosphorylase [Vicingaceae bacterium]MDB4061782.1 purine-nucleoside phosphorylase [Vicingaceae bacterium]MDC1451774.1 purine-nucleoside phosphorylase [Vicingaceae bacterium]